MNQHFETIACNVCGSEKQDFVSNEGQFGLPVNVVICKNCGLSYLNPRWTKATYLDFYTHKYDQYYRPNFDGLKIREPNPIYTRLSDRQLLNQVHHILDIGSGAGENLRYFKSKFPKTAYYAIEPSAQAIEMLKRENIEVISNDADSDWESNFPQKFDFIIMRHVLEHFSDPSAILKKVNHCLSEDGILYLAVPNCLKPTTPLKTNWFRVVHTYYFNRYSIFNILASNQLEIIDLQEGDAFNQGELFAFVKRSKKTLQPEITQKAYLEQKAVFAEKLQQENKLWPKLKRKVKSLKQKLS